MRSLSHATALAVFALFCLAPSARSEIADQTIHYADQGADWTSAAREQFYVQDQGAQMMLLPWLKALKQADGKPFLTNSFSRYGYLPNPKDPDGLPVGFTTASTDRGTMTGMTCSACHTRQIEVDKKLLRIDGGPAIVDFQTFLADLDKAVLAVQASDAAFTDFAKAVLGTDYSIVNAAILRADVAVWSVRFDTLIQNALPKDPWGPSRLDAVSMIFNRLTGLDLGTAPTYIIEKNIMKADAPTRYPFLWNAPIQDHTQWPGFADNGDDILALSRNLGEVYGVFGTFHPKPTQGWFKLNRNYIGDNSANFDGLKTLETLVKRIGPPAWPWPYDRALAAQGEAIYERTTANGGCADCHDIKKGEPRFLNWNTWKTPIQDVGTDTREWSVLFRPAKSGSLKGAEIPFLTKALGEDDVAFNILATSVLGAIIQNAAPVVSLNLQMARGPVSANVAGSAPQPSSPDVVSVSPDLTQTTTRIDTPLTPQLQGLGGAFKLPGLRSPTMAADAKTPAKNAYESRVLEGIWATAPYLHNGSVPTLADLLKPVAERPKRFKIGPAYDTSAIGLAEAQTAFDYVLVTTDCSNRDSGNSNCGHEYGTHLKDSEKKALLEYLKSL